jgi:hypothetical protein
MFAAWFRVQQVLTIYPPLLALLPYNLTLILMRPILIIALSLTLPSLVEGGWWSRPLFRKRVSSVSFEAPLVNQPTPVSPATPLTPSPAPNLNHVILGAPLPVEPVVPPAIPLPGDVSPLQVPLAPLPLPQSSPDSPAHPTNGTSSRPPSLDDSYFLPIGGLYDLQVAASIPLPASSASTLIWHEGENSVEVGPGEGEGNDQGGEMGEAASGEVNAPVSSNIARRFISYFSGLLTKLCSYDTCHTTLSTPSPRTTISQGDEDSHSLGPYVHLDDPAPPF